MCIRVLDPGSSHEMMLWRIPPPKRESRRVGKDRGPCRCDSLLCLLFGFGYFVILRSRNPVRVGDGWRSATYDQWARWDGS